MVTFWHSCFSILFKMPAAKIKISTSVLPLVSFLFMFAAPIVPDTQRAKDLISKTCFYKLWMSLYKFSCLNLNLRSYSGLYPVFGFILLCGCCFLTVFFRLSSDLVHHWVCKGVEEVWYTLQEVKISLIWEDCSSVEICVLLGARSLKMILRLGHEHVQFHLLSVVVAGLFNGPHHSDWAVDVWQGSLHKPRFQRNFPCIDLSFVKLGC